jgi:alpha-tubulin suppressor-like RCC1 family protein
LSKPIESLQVIKVDAVVTSILHTLALADDGSVYAWGNCTAAEEGALGLSPSLSGAKKDVHTPQRIPNLRVASGL